MKKGTTRFSLLFLFLIFAISSASAQTATTGSNILLYTVFGVAIVMMLFGVIQVADNLLRVEAQQIGADKSGANYSVFPKLNEISRPKMAEYLDGKKVHYLKRGYDLNLEGEAPKVIQTAETTTFAVQPSNFLALSPIPKVEVEEGAHVKAGDILFYDKKESAVKYAAPVSGEVIAVNRGQKRSISEILILADKEQQYRSYSAFDLNGSPREELVNYMLDSGVWPMIRQRPFNVVADYKEIPRDIFISTFDSAPLAPDLNLVVDGRGAAFQKGLDVLGKLTDGKVHLGLDARGESAPSSVFTNAVGVEKHWFYGPHPSGNVGVQIHNIDPIGASDKIWTVGVQEVITIGALFLEGKFSADRVVVISGAELVQPRYVRTFQGANIGELISGNLKTDHVRYISGDVLSGQKKEKNNFLNFYDDQVTVIQEGDEYEMFGWLLPLKSRPSISPTFPTNFLFSDQKFRVTTNTHGEKRAFVVTGQYEKVLPMDIYLQQLMKAIMINDFERMEGLGLYELVEEDVALAEFVCTSKQPLQSILRDGLNTLREQG